MAIGGTFKFSDAVHINVGNKNMLNNYVFATSRGAKGQMNESQHFFVQAKAFEPLTLYTTLVVNVPTA